MLLTYSNFIYVLYVILINLKINLKKLGIAFCIT